MCVYSILYIITNTLTNRCDSVCDFKYCIYKLYSWLIIAVQFSLMLSKQLFHLFREDYDL